MALQLVTIVLDLIRYHMAPLDLSYTHAIHCQLL